MDGSPRFDEPIGLAIQRVVSDRFQVPLIDLSHGIGHWETRPPAELALRIGEPFSPVQSMNGMLPVSSAYYDGSLCSSGFHPSFSHVSAASATFGASPFAALEGFGAGGSQFAAATPVALNMSFGVELGPFQAHQRRPEIHSRPHDGAPTRPGGKLAKRLWALAGRFAPFPPRPADSLPFVFEGFTASETAWLVRSLDPPKYERSVIPFDGSNRDAALLVLEQEIERDLLTLLVLGTSRDGAVEFLRQGRRYLRRLPRPQLLRELLVSSLHSQLDQLVKVISPHAPPVGPLLHLPAGAALG